MRLLTALAFLLAGPALAQSTPPDPNAAAIAALQTYELPDHTASARLPANWTVVATGVAFIQARGPNGELALFGVMVPATDSSPTALSPGGITQPYSTDPAQKFLETINWIRAHNNKPPVQAQFYGEAPISAPPAFGQCNNIHAVLNGVAAVEADFCSLPANPSGQYHNFFKAVGLPLSQARQERTLMEAILASYRLNINAIKAARAAQASAPPPAPTGSASATISAENSIMANQLMMQEAQAINQETINSEISSDQSFQDFDHGVLLGQTPIYAEGMQQPLFWVGGD